MANDTSHPLGRSAISTSACRSGAHLVFRNKRCPYRVRQRRTGDPGDTSRRLAAVMTFAITTGKIVAIDVIADAQRLDQLELP